MNPDKLIKGNSYVFQDHDLSFQTVLFDRMVEVDGNYMFRFNLRVGYLDLPMKKVYSSVFEEQRKNPFL